MAWFRLNGQDAHSRISSAHFATEICEAHGVDFACLTQFWSLRTSTLLRSRVGAEALQRSVRMGIMTPGSGGLQGGFDQGGGETFLLSAGLGEAGLEAVAEGHQFVDFGDDA